MNADRTARVHGELLFSAAQMAAVLSVLPMTFRPAYWGASAGPESLFAVAGFSAVLGSAAVLLVRRSSFAGRFMGMLIAACALLQAICCALCACCYAVPSLAALLQPTIAALACFGIAPLTALWLKAFSGCGLREIMVNAIASFMVFSGLMLAFVYIPGPAAMQSCALFAIAFAGSILAIRTMRPHGDAVETDAMQPSDSAAPDASGEGSNEVAKRLLDLFVGVGALGCFLAAFTLPFDMGDGGDADHFAVVSITACVVMAACLGYFLHRVGRVSANQLRFSLFDVALPSLALVAFAIKMIPIEMFYDVAFRNYMELYFLVLGAAFWINLSLFVRANPKMLSAAAGISVALITACAAAGNLAVQLNDGGRYVMLGLVTATFLIMAIIRVGRNLVLLAKGTGMQSESAGPMNMLDVCAQVSRRYQLTQRETEVLGELAYGHSSTYIAEVLFISTNTVRSHMKNIYRKLEVNSREEVIELLRSECGMQG